MIERYRNGRPSGYGVDKNESEKDRRMRGREKGGGRERDDSALISDRPRCLLFI